MQATKENGCFLLFFNPFNGNFVSRFILQTGLRDHFYNKEAYVQEVTANMIRAVSNLISEEKRMAWMDLRLQIRMKLVNNLLLALEDLAFLLADVTETPELLEEAASNICKFPYLSSDATKFRQKFGFQTCFGRNRN